MCATREARQLILHKLTPIGIRPPDHAIREQVLGRIRPRHLVHSTGIVERHRPIFAREKPTHFRGDAEPVGFVLDDQLINLELFAVGGDMLDQSPLLLAAVFELAFCLTGKLLQISPPVEC